MKMLHEAMDYWSKEYTGHNEKYRTAVDRVE